MQFTAVNLSAFVPLITMIGACLFSIVLVVFRLGGVAARLDIITQKVDDIAKLDTRVTSLEGRTTGHSERISTIEARFNKMVDDRR